MKEKMEKDVNAAKNNKRLLLTAGIIIALVAAIYLISVLVGGEFRDFCESAVIWVLIGIGVAFSVTYFNQKE